MGSETHMPIAYQTAQYEARYQPVQFCDEYVRLVRDIDGLERYAPGLITRFWLFALRVRLAFVERTMARVALDERTLYRIDAELAACRARYDRIVRQMCIF